jgi:tetratricopeptide (TPR) repeat protein
MTGATPGGLFGGDVAPVSRPVIGTMGQFRIHEIRRGGMGEVLICSVAASDEAPSLALKSFQKRFFFHGASRRAFIREVAIWARLTGESHIVPVMGLYYLDDRPFVLMPRFESTLREILDTQGPSSGLAARAALHIAVGLARAQSRLGHLVHGDLKPENVLTTGVGFLVSDLGLARVIAESGESDELEGTWAYRAPELWDGKPPSVKSDIYAFGTILYEALVGTTPLRGSNRDEWAQSHRTGLACASCGLQDALGSALMNVALPCLAREPQDRPADFVAVVGEIRHALDHADPLEALVLMTDTMKLAELFAQVRVEVSGQVAGTLLELGESRLALEYLEDLPDDTVTSETARRHGDALSLEGRDAEALAWFDRALELDPHGPGIQGRVSRALSLKRLGDCAAAASELESLLGHVEQADLLAVVVNLATVYLEDGRPQEARDLLWRNAHSMPPSAELWGNLGEAYEELGEREEAVRAFRRAVRLAPQRPDHQVRLARSALRCGGIGEADAAVEAAWTQGANDVNWASIACAVFRPGGRDEHSQQIMEQARRDLSEEDRVRFESEVAALVRDGSEQ